MFLRPFGLYCNACFGTLFVSSSYFQFSKSLFIKPSRVVMSSVCPFLLLLEVLTSILLSPGQVTGLSQGKSSGGAATLMPLDLHALL